MIHSDGDFTIPQHDGPRRWSQPFPDNVLYVFEQNWMVLSAYYEPALLDTQDEDFPDFYLVAESAPQLIGATMLGFVRTYASVPKPRDEYGSYSYTFPGINAGTVAPDRPYYNYGREPMTLTVPSRIRHDFWHVGKSISPVTGNKIVNPYDIPTIEAFRAWGIGGRGWPADSQKLGEISIPTSEQYLGKVYTYQAQTIANWLTPTQYKLVYLGSEIVAEDSTIERWMGNIYMRTTRYVRAQ